MRKIKPVKKLATEKHAGGRPNTYDPKRYPAIAAAFARDGKSQSEIARIFGISRDTLHDWTRKYPEFSDSLRETREQADGRVTASLFQKAVGYEVEEIEQSIDEKGRKRLKKTKRHIQGDVTAQKYWLANRRPAEWREKVDHQHTGKDGGPIETEVTHIVTDLAKCSREFELFSNGESRVGERLLPKDSNGESVPQSSD